MCTHDIWTHGAVFYDIHSLQNGHNEGMVHLFVHSTFNNKTCSGFVSRSMVFMVSKYNGSGNQIRFNEIE